MRIRALIAAICAAGFAAGPAVMQARADVQPNVSRSGYAVVGTDVDAVSALTPLSGSISWTFGLYSFETTDVTNLRIHVAPPSGPAPPDVTAATLAPNGSLYDYLPSVPGVVTPAFDSSRAMSGTADPGTHTQTVTVTLTPHDMPFGYTSAWTWIEIDGLSTATNSAVVSAPGSAFVSYAGTNHIGVSFSTLPQTQYTVQVTFDVTNPNAAAVPYKPRVYISEYYSAPRTATPQAQSSYTFTDPEPGTATWSLDQSVIWTPYVSLQATSISDTPIAVAAVAAGQATGEGRTSSSRTRRTPSARRRCTPDGGPGMDRSRARRRCRSPLRRSPSIGARRPSRRR